MEEQLDKNDAWSPTDVFAKRLGIAPFQGNDRCAPCGGSGKISVGGGWAGYSDEICSSCNGTGKREAASEEEAPKYAPPSDEIASREA